MKCTSTTYCSNPRLNDIGNEMFCFNCYSSYNKDTKVFNNKN